MKVTCKPTIEHWNVCDADRILYCLHDRLTQQRHLKCWWEDRKILKFKGPTGFRCNVWVTPWCLVRDGHAKIEYIEGIPGLIIKYRFRWNIHLFLVVLQAGLMAMIIYAHNFADKDGSCCAILLLFCAVIILGTLGNYYGTVSSVKNIGGKSIQDAAVGGHIEKKNGIFQRIRDWFRL